MTDIYCTENTATTMITANALPAILIGGPPNAGKSVLTYNLTRELRRLDIPHYVFRANPDIEGDWFLQDDQDNVRQLTMSIKEYRGKWKDEFRRLVCRDLSLRRHLPLIVDLGGLPNEQDHCIFRACTDSILLLKNGTAEDKAISQTWRTFARTDGLNPLAEIDSQEFGKSALLSSEPIITGTLAEMKRGKLIHGRMFDAIVHRVRQVFGPYSKEMLEELHLHTAPIEFVVRLPHQLSTFVSDTEEWTPDMLERLLAELPAQTELAVYGRGPNWLYGALALHAGTQPFYQFDARLGWVRMPTLRTGTSWQSTQSPLYIEQYTDDEQYAILMHPIHNYLDYEERDQLEFPEPPPDRGVIVSGKLPLWLFTALARFYAQWDVPWIALNDAYNNKAIVIYSRVEAHQIGDMLLMPV